MTPTGYVHAVRVAEVVHIARRVVGGEVLGGGVIAPGYSAIIPQGEAEQSVLWFVPDVTGLDLPNNGVFVGGVSVFGIDSNGVAYADDTGASAGEEALLTFDSLGNYYIDDLAVTE